MANETTERLEYLRSQIRAECISMGELVELQGMADQIEPGDVELLEWAGVPEFGEDMTVRCTLFLQADDVKTQEAASEQVRSQLLSMDPAEIVALLAFEVEPFE